MRFQEPLQQSMIRMQQRTQKKSYDTPPTKQRPQAPSPEVGNRIQPSHDDKYMRTVAGHLQAAEKTGNAEHGNERQHAQAPTTNPVWPHFLHKPAHGGTEL